MPASKLFHGVGTARGCNIWLSCDVPGFFTPAVTVICSNPRMTPPEQCLAITKISNSGKAVG